VVQLAGWVVLATALVFVVLHRNAAREYLAAYRAAHRGETPGIEWLTTRDADPGVERLRLRRLAMVIPASVLVMLGIWLAVFVPA
jgi:hypothetical protein